MDHPEVEGGILLKDALDAAMRWLAFSRKAQMPL
jgi:hypothetical protein